MKTMILYILGVFCLLNTSCIPEKVVYRPSTTFQHNKTVVYDMTKFYPIDSCNTVILYNDDKLIVASYYDTIINYHNYDSISKNILFNLRGVFQDTSGNRFNPITSQFDLYRLVERNKAFVIYKGNYLKRLKIVYYTTMLGHCGLQRWYYRGIKIHQAWDCF